MRFPHHTSSIYSVCESILSLRRARRDLSLSEHAYLTIPLPVDSVFVTDDKRPRSIAARHDKPYCYTAALFSTTRDGHWFQVLHKPSHGVCWSLATFAQLHVWHTGETAWSL